MSPSNSSDQLANSTQPALSRACSLLGNLAWKQEYLTTRTFLMLVVILCVEALLSLPTISLNVLVIWAVKAKFYLRKQNACVLLACLAVTDLLVGAVVLPLVIASHLERLVGSGPMTCLMDLAVNGALHVACFGSLLHLAIISLERYVAIKHALRYEALVTARRLTAAVSGAWAIDVVSLVALAAFVEHAVSFAVLSCVILCVVAVITFCQVALFLESRRHRRHIREHQISQDAAKEILREEKAARTTTMIIGALVLCYILPQLVYTVFMEASFMKPESLCIMYSIDVLLYSNSLINPLIYCVRTRDFKRAFKELVHFTNSQVNSGAEMQPVADSTTQRTMNGQTHVELSHKTTRTAWPARTCPRVSRTRSLELLSDASHQPRPVRKNSI